MIQLPGTIERLLDDGALFVINHSAGKDSQAMTLALRGLIPAQQMVVVHADLGEVEWAGNLDHISRTIGDLPLHICRNENKTFLEMVERRGMWPSASTRQCTSDLKRGPIERTVRAILAESPAFCGRVVNCMGIRAEESPARARQQPLRYNERNSKAGRSWYDWLPIFDWTCEEVFSAIEAAGQRPHPAYGLGMSRLSCVFCILASKGDLRVAGAHNPDLYRRYVRLRQRMGHTLSMSGVPLETLTGIVAAE